MATTSGAGVPQNGNRDARDDVGVSETLRCVDWTHHLLFVHNSLIPVLIALILLLIRVLKPQNNPGSGQT